MRHRYVLAPEAPKSSRRSERTGQSGHAPGTVPVQLSAPGFTVRSFLVSPRRCLLSSRRFFDASVGRVGRLDFGASGASTHPAPQGAIERVEPAAPLRPH